MDGSLVVLARETSQESYFYTLGGIREKGKSNKGPSGMELNQSGMPSGLPLVHLHPTSVVEPGGTRKTLHRDRLSATREGNLQWRLLSTPPSRAGKDASGGKKPLLWMLLFSVLWMGASSSRTSPLKCIFLKSWDKFDPQNLKTCLICFCDTEWPQYPLEDREC